MEFVIIFLLILFNGFFALSEIALISSKPSRLKELKQKGSRGAEKALLLLTNSERFLSAIQVGITMISMITGLYGGSNLAVYIAPLFEKIPYINSFSVEIALTVSVLLITYVAIVIGELVPKTIALNYPEKVAVRVAPFISTFSKIFYPFVKLLAVSTNLLTRTLGVKKEKQNITESELRQMMRTAYLEGVIEKEQNILHQKVFSFSDKKAKHIMTHRSEIRWVDINKPIDELAKDLRNINYSKTICCKGDIDQFVGFVYMRDVYRAYSKNSQLNISDLIVPPTIVHENTDAQKILSQLQEDNVHLWFVVNEFGMLEGIITLHNIIEGILGQIPESSDFYEPDVFIREDHSMLVHGDAPVETLTNIIENFSVDYNNTHYATVAGFIFEQLDNIPKLGDKFDFQNYTFEIVDMDRNRINKVLISKIN